MNTSTKKSALPDITDWNDINWLSISQYVEKLQQRIYHAERLGEIRKVRNLQRLLMRSQAALLLSIRRVTQINKGRRTAGVDGYKALTPHERVELYSPFRTRKPIVFRRGMKVRLDTECYQKTVRFVAL